MNVCIKPRVDTTPQQVLLLGIELQFTIPNRPNDPPSFLKSHQSQVSAFKCYNAFINTYLCICVCTFSIHKRKYSHTHIYIYIYQHTYTETCITKAQTRHSQSFGVIFIMAAKWFNVLFSYPISFFFLLLFRCFLDSYTSTDIVECGRDLGALDEWQLFQPFMNFNLHNPG